MIAKVSKTVNKPIILPVICMRGIVAFPSGNAQFDIGRERSIAAVEKAVKDGTPLFLLTQKNIADEQPTREQLYDYGVVAVVKQVFRISPDYIKVLVDCRYRARMQELISSDPCYLARVKRVSVRSVPEASLARANAIVRSLRDQVDVYAEHYPKLSKDILLTALSEKDFTALVEFLASNLSLDYEDKQLILDCSSALKRLELFYSILSKENELLDYEFELSEKVKASIDKNQREYYLREQQRVISQELGDGDDTAAEADDYTQKIAQLKLPQDSQDKLLREVSRLRKMQGFTQEASVLRTYLDTVLDLPWNTETDDVYDIAAARKKLDADHYGLEKVKQRVLELLAVRSVSDKLNSQIVCLVGPPGVGKTSIVRSIADCMGRKYVRLSLGGVKDESEIRGHRKTYVGSMPGRIISALITAKSRNPVILLDEIDKLGNDIKGDPASALLEVLDPEQNFDFKDNYIEIPFDLSQVLFITTANDASMIPAPLYDRMEIIELSSYTRIEKFHIAKKHFLRKQMNKHALTAAQFSLTDRALYGIVDGYTMEAGVRALEKQIAKLCRKAVTEIVEKKAESIKITHENLESYLGVPSNRGMLMIHKDTVGSCNGLAWTSYGGEILPLEAVCCHGTGKLELTGMLGDVMKESAKIAVTLARELADKYGFDTDFTGKTDIHIHAPEGAIKKDGPSAGVALITALVSVLSGRPAVARVAMTGEITLGGQVLVIGGLKEKLIAAVKGGIKTVVIPKDNLPDLSEMSEEVTGKLEIVPVETVQQALEVTLRAGKPPRKKELLHIEPTEEPRTKTIPS